MNYEGANSAIRLALLNGERRPTLLEMEAQRDRDEAAFRAHVETIAHTGVRIAGALEQLLALLKAKEICEHFQ